MGYFTDKERGLDFFQSQPGVERNRRVVLLQVINMLKAPKTKTLFFLLIICLAGLLRFYQLGVNPPSLSWDEAALGYNAFSIGQTGRDEFGRYLPYDYFTSFGDYKPPLYVYAAVLPVKVFGLNEFAVRFPSALSGLLAVILTYLLVKELFPKWKDSWLPILAGFFMAISPWHTQISRAAWEANLASFLVILGALLFLKAVNSARGALLLLSGISFVACFYTFNSVRIFVPLLVLGLAIFFWREALKIRRWFLISAIISFFLLLPLLPHLLSPQARLRFEEVNIFSDIKVIEASNRWVDKDNNILWSRLIHNRRVLFLLSFFEHYFHHFEGKFLFISGDSNPKFSLQDVGQLYLFDLPFLLLGAYWLFKKERKASRVVFWWLLAAPIPAAVARETPHALRILNSLPCWQIITAYGFFVFLGKIRAKPNLFKNLLLSFVFIFLCFNGFYYLHNYYFHYPVEFAGEWQYGYREAVKIASRLENNYDRVVMTKNLGRPYIYFLFYKKYPPRLFWQYKNQVVKEAIGFINVEGFDKYEFRGLDWEKDRLVPKTLYIMSPIDIPKEARIIETINLPDGKPILVVFE